MSDERSASSGLWGYAEALAKATAVIAAAGYLSHRAHLNRLGIPAESPLSSERYLAEAWYVVSASVELLIPIAVPVLAAAAVALLIARLARSWRPPLGWLTGELERPWAAVAALVALIVFTIKLFPDKHGGTLVGSLKGLGDFPATRQQEVEYQLALAAWAAAALAVGWVLRRLAAAERLGLLEGIAGAGWSAVRMGLLAALLALCVRFGDSVHEATYPAATATYGESGAPQKASGALVLDSGESLLLWSASGGKGTVTVVPRQKLISLELGDDVDLFSAACLAAGGGVVDKDDRRSCGPKGGP